MQRPDQSAASHILEVEGNVPQDSRLDAFFDQYHGLNYDSDSGTYIFGDSDVSVDTDECASSSSEDDENVQQDIGHNRMEHDIDPSSECTHTDHDVIVTMLVALMTKHRLKGELRHDLVELINLLLNKYTGKKINPNMVYSYVQDKKFDSEKHYYCLVCSMSVLENDEECRSCNTRFPEGSSETGKSYFLSLPIKAQIESILSREDIYKYFKQDYIPRRDGVLGDIKDGKLYQQLLDSRHGDNSSLLASFLWSSDGVRIFRSSHIDMWPFYLSLNEIPAHLRFRHENLVLAGVWTGKSKPQFLTFLKPVFTQLEQLSSDHGVPINTCKGKRRMQCYVLGGTCDLPARAALLGMIQFNGASSCHKCYDVGETAPSGRGSVHVYRHHTAQRRTDDEFRHDGELAIANMTMEKGLKGPCIFSYLRKYSIVNGTCIDTMHGIFLGLIKVMITRWFTLPYKQEKFSFHQMAGEFNKRIKSIKPPMSVKRPPRSLDDLKHYKASEFAIVLLMYLPILYDVISEEYFDHFSLLSSAIFTLYQSEITQQELATARENINSYCEQFEDLYALRYQGSNFHNLGQHIVDDVENLGPCSNFDCFEFESLYGDILKLIHGTQGVNQQIVRAVSTLHRLPRMAEEITDDKARAFVEKMLTFEWATNEKKLEDNMFSMGAISRTITDHEKQVFEQALPLLVGFLPVNILVNMSFKRFRYFNRVYHCQCYTRVSKRNSYTVQYDRIDRTGSTLKYGFLLKFYSLDITDAGGRVSKIHVARVKPIQVVCEEVGAAQHIKVVIPPVNDDPESVIYLHNIRKLCVYMKFEGITHGYVSMVPNISRIV